MRIWRKSKVFRAAGVTFIIVLLASLLSVRRVLVLEPVAVFQGGT